MYNRQSVMANQGRQTINAMRAMTPKEYLSGRNIVDQEPCRDLEPDSLPPLAGPLPMGGDNFVNHEGELLHRGTDHGPRSGTYNSSNRGTVQRGLGNGGGYQDAGSARGTTFTQGHHGNLLDGIDEEDSHMIQDSGMMDEYKRRIRELEIEVQRLNGQVAESRGQLDGYQIERDKMITEYEEYIDSLQDELEQYKAIESLVKKLQGEKEFLEEEIEKVRKIKAMLENQINNYNETEAIRDLKNQMDIIIEENKRLKRLNKAAGDGADVARLRNELNTMGQQLDFLEKERNLLQNDKDSMVLEIKKLRNKGDNSTGTGVSGNRGNGADKGALEAKTREWEMERLRFNNQIKDWKKMCEGLESEKGRLSKALYEKTNDPGLVNSQLIGFESGFGGGPTQKNFGGLMTSQNPDSIQNNNLGTIQESTESRKLERQQLNNLQNENGDLQFRINSLQRELEAMKNAPAQTQNTPGQDNTANKKEIDRLQDEVFKKDRKIQDLMRELSQAENQKPPSRGSRKGSRRGSRVQDSMVDDLNEEIDALKKDKSKLKKKIQTLRAENDDLDNENQDLQARLKSAEKSGGNGGGNDAQIDKMQDKIDDLKQENKKFAYKNDELKVKVKEIKTQLKAAKAEAGSKKPLQVPEANVFDGSFSVEQAKPKKPSNDDQDVVDEENGKPKKKRQGAEAPLNKLTPDEKDKIIEALKIKMFVLGSENERLKGLYNGNMIVPGSSRRIIPSTIIRDPSPSNLSGAGRIYTRSPEQSVRTINGPSSYRAPVVVKQSQASNYPSFGGISSRRVARPNYKPNMLQTVPWDAPQVVGPTYDDQSRIQRPVLTGPSHHGRSMSPNDGLINDLQNVINRYSDKKIPRVSQNASPRAYGVPVRSPSPNQPAMNPLKLDYASTSPMRLKTPPRSMNFNQNPTMQGNSPVNPSFKPKLTGGLLNPLKKSYDRQPQIKSIQKPFNNLPSNINQNPVLSMGRDLSNSKLKKFNPPNYGNMSRMNSGTKQDPFARPRHGGENVDPSQRRSNHKGLASVLNQNYNQAPTLSTTPMGQSPVLAYPNSGYKSNDPGAYVLNNVYQPSMNEESPNEFLIPQPKRESSMKQSDLSQGTNAFSERASRHPYAESIAMTYQTSGQKRPPSHHTPQIPSGTGAGVSPSFGHQLSFQEFQGQEMVP